MNGKNSRREALSWFLIIFLVASGGWPTVSVIMKQTSISAATMTEWRNPPLTQERMEHMYQTATGMAGGGSVRPASLVMALRSSILVASSTAAAPTSVMTTSVFVLSSSPRFRLNHISILFRSNNPINPIARSAE